MKPGVSTDFGINVSKGRNDMAKHKTLLEKALLVIEALVSDDLTQDLEFAVAMHPDKTPLIKDEDAKIFNNKLTAIYCISHGVNPGSCYSVHADWRADLEKRYRKLKRVGAFRVTVK